MRKIHAKHIEVSLIHQEARERVNYYESITTIIFIYNHDTSCFLLLKRAWYGYNQFLPCNYNNFCLGKIFQALIRVPDMETVEYTTIYYNQSPVFISLFRESVKLFWNDGRRTEGIDEGDYEVQTSNCKILLSHGDVMHRRETIITNIVITSYGDRM